jgi:hypothetical protein
METLVVRSWAQPGRDLAGIAPSRLAALKHIQRRVGWGADLGDRHGQGEPLRPATH